jgi:hypothetical protein
MLAEIRELELDGPIYFHLIGNESSVDRLLRPKTYPSSKRVLMVFWCHFSKFLDEGAVGYKTKESS